MTVFPISPIHPTAHPRVSRGMGAMGHMRRRRQTTIAPDAESAEVLENIKALLK